MYLEMSALGAAMLQRWTLGLASVLCMTPMVIGIRVMRGWAVLLRSNTSPPACVWSGAYQTGCSRPVLKRRAGKGGARAERQAKQWQTPCF
jgi:hypothetical protein